MSATDIRIQKSVDQAQEYKTTRASGKPLIFNVFAGSALLNREWIKIFSVITLLFAVTLLSFLSCYTSGVFHHEQFIGPIGSSVSIGLSTVLVLVSGLVLYLSSKRAGS
jgi:hypothetical protein